MNDIIEDIVRKKKSSIAKRKKAVPLAELEIKARAQSRRDFGKALENRDRVNIIAEIKQASPSAGIISRDFSPSKIAKQYTEGGAAAISVLTEEEYFKGDLAYLGAVRDNSPLPVLCKDFIFDPYQVYEAAAFGADAVLLIASILYGDELAVLIRTAKELGLSALVEVHDKAELDKVLKTDARIIGINNRNLRDLSINLDTALALISLIPRDKLVIVESGIRSAEDIKLYEGKGVNAFLVGEALMSRDDMILALKELING